MTITRTAIRGPKGRPSETEMGRRMDDFLRRAGKRRLTAEAFEATDPDGDGLTLKELVPPGALRRVMDILLD